MTTVPATDLAPVYFDVPLVNPAPNGLYAVTNWTEVTGPSRFLAGAQLRATGNYGGEAAFGVWEAAWCTAATAWAVQITGSGTYRLAVNGTPTTDLTEVSTPAEIEYALNQTSGPVGLDVEGTPTSYVVHTDTPAILTVAGSAGITVTVVPTDYPDSGEVKYGTRADDPPPFDPMTVWAYDECDLTAESQAEVQARVQQVLRLQEQIAVERTFAARLLSDAPAPTAGDIVTALGALEAELAVTNTVGVIHASPVFAALAAKEGLLTRSGAALKTPLGNVWCFGGGYVETLAGVMVATSPTFGWRDTVAVRDATGLPEINVYAAIAERSVLVAYEKAVASAQVEVA